MKRYRTLLLCACLGLIGLGCETINHTQYYVVGPTSLRGVRASVSAADQAAVKEILDSLAKRLRYEDRTKESLIPNIIVSYTQPSPSHPVAFYPIRIHAWRKEDKVVVDVMQEPGTPGETQAYRDVVNLVINELKGRFGERLVVATQKDRRQKGPPGSA